MSMRKFLSVMTAVALTITIVTPFSAKSLKAEASSFWNVERYGDRIDIDSTLSDLTKDSAFLAQAEKAIKEQAKEISNDTTKASLSATSNSTFTFDGGTKYFLNRDLNLKTFTLRSIGKNVEIWVDNNLSFPAGDPRPVPVITQEQVDKLRNEFDSNIYPKDTEFFGTPDVHDGAKSPLPGMLGLPADYYCGSEKVIMLVDNIRDDNYYDPTYPFFVAGFYWQTLENYIDRNIITIDTNSWESRLESTFYGTTIHELQHLIHADNDSAEESWINEGMSTFSEYLGGYGHDDGSINFYLDHPENSLVNWDEHKVTATGPETIADYGQVYLFTLYMNDKFGKEFIRELATNKSHGINSVNEVLKARGISLDFTKLYQNFITAVAIDDNINGTNVYNFDSINLRDLVVDKIGTKRGITVNYEKALTYEKSGVPAWGGDFKDLDFRDKIRNISFNGVAFLPTPWKVVTDPKNPTNEVLWANTGDESDNMLILEADLSKASGATLKFDNYYNIEEQWDFGVVQVSTDGGATWTSLGNEHTRSDIVNEGYPKIKENLPGFTGASSSWQKETFDLSEYSGQKVLISFRYMTDWGSNEAGWYIDNIQIPEIGFANSGNSLGAFKSLNEIMKNYVEYTVTFINVRETGNKNGSKTAYKVITINPFNVTETDALNLRQLFQEGKNYMITSYAAPINDKNPVDFTYKITLKNSHKVNNK